MLGAFMFGMSCAYAPETVQKHAIMHNKPRAFLTPFLSITLQP
jgi:hypothetical protein